MSSRHGIVVWIEKRMWYHAATWTTVSTNVTSNTKFLVFWAPSAVRSRDNSGGIDPRRNDITIQYQYSKTYKMNKEFIAQTTHFLFVLIPFPPVIATEYSALIQSKPAGSSQFGKPVQYDH